MCMLTYFFFVFCLFLIWETSSIFLSLCPIECRLNSNSVSRIARARSWLRHHRQFHITSTRLSVSIGRGNESKDFQAQKKCYPWRGYFFKQNEIQRHRFLVDPWMWHAMIGIVSFQFNGQDVFGHDFTILCIQLELVLIPQTNVFCRSSIFSQVFVILTGSGCCSPRNRLFVPMIHEFVIWAKFFLRFLFLGEVFKFDKRGYLILSSSANRT